LVISAVLYVLMALVMVGITDYRMLNVPNPVSFAVGQVPALAWLALPINIGALIGLASVIFVSLYGQSRIFYCMARDGFLWPLFGAVHPTYRTPHRGTLVTGLVAAVLSPSERCSPSSSCASAS
jgi:APA family basic amino acid/polyamine antiporter